MRSLSVLFLLSLLAAPGCASTDADPLPDDAVRVLFVGNSLTYTHDLPALVAAFAAHDGRPLGVETVAYPNFSLEDHWHRGGARGALATGRYDAVVLQQGPSSLPENAEHLRRWVARWAEEAHAHGTDAAVYMVWPAADRRAALAAVEASYTAAADSAGARLLPAGSAWREAWDRDDALPLYGPDGFHPSETGTYLAALVVYGGLTGASLEALPHEVERKGGTVRIAPLERARLLKHAAAKALEGVAAEVGAGQARRR